MSLSESQPKNEKSKKHGLLLRVAHNILDWVDPERHAEGVVYGIITVGAVIAIESASDLAPSHDIAGTILVLVVYWMVHSYSTVMGNLFRTKEAWHWGLVKETMRDEFSIMRGAALPIIMMTIFALCGAGSTEVMWAGLVTVIVLIMAFQAVAGARAGLRGLALSAQLAVGLFFGLFLIVIKYVVG